MNNEKNSLEAMQLRFAVENFYYMEASLLDDRQYKQWLSLCDPQIRYTMPARGNPLVNNRESGNESMISIERELERAADPSPMASPIRDEGYAHLFLRVERSYKKNSWAENPPARTRRVIGNVRIDEDNGEQLTVRSNFHLNYARPGSRNFFYSGERRDTLNRSASSFVITAREIVMDIADIELPTLGLFF